MLNADILLVVAGSQPVVQAESKSAASLLRDARAGAFAHISAALEAAHTSAARPFEANFSGPRLARGQLLELCGSPGSGKTRLCLSYAIEARLRPREDDQAREIDPEREVLLVDTEGGLPADQVFVAALAATESQDLAMQVVEGIHLTRAHSRDHIPALLHSMETLLATRPLIGLIIIDALSPPLRTHLLPILLPPAPRPQATKRARLSTEPADGPPAMRTHLLHLTRRTLGQLVSRPVAVIATVQLASRRKAGSSMLNGNERRSSTLAPALGSNWHTNQVWRITLFSDDMGRHKAHWTMTPPSQRHLEGRQVAFQVCEEGVQDEQD